MAVLGEGLRQPYNGRSGLISVTTLLGFFKPFARLAHLQSRLVAIISAWCTEELLYLSSYDHVIAQPVSSRPLQPKRSPHALHLALGLVHMTRPCPPARFAPPKQRAL